MLPVLDSLLSASLSPDFYSSNGQNMALGALKILRIFRIFRALRPLRVIARAKGLRILVSTLLSAVKPVINTVAIAFCIFSVLGILGMQLMSGRLNSCTDRRVWSAPALFRHTTRAKPNALVTRRALRSRCCPSPVLTSFCAAARYKEDCVGLDYDGSQRQV